MSEVRNEPELKPEEKPEVKEDDLLPGETNKKVHVVDLTSKSRPSKSSFKVYLMCIVFGLLDIYGLANNWIFEIGTMAPWSDQRALSAVNGTYIPDEFDRDYFNLSMAICNPDTKGQVSGKSMKSFLFIYSTLGVSVSTFFLLLGLCLSNSGAMIGLPWLMRVYALKRPSISDQSIELASNFRNIMSFITQDFMMLVCLGYYTFSCKASGTFGSLQLFLTYVFSVVNLFRRAYGLIRNLVKKNSMGDIIGSIGAIVAGPGIIWCCCLALALAMIIVPIARFFQYGMGKTLF